MRRLIVFFALLLFAGSRSRMIAATSGNAPIVHLSDRGAVVSAVRNIRLVMKGGQIVRGPQ